MNPHNVYFNFAKKKFMFASIICGSFFFGSAAQPQTTVDFTNATAYGLDAETVMIENLRVDVAM